MKVKLFLIIFIILGLCFSLFQIFLNDSSAKISEKEAQDIATNLYGGKVLDYKEQNGNHQMTLENDRGIYNVVVDGNTKTVSNLKLIDPKEALLTVEEAKTMIMDEMQAEVIQIEKAVKDGQPLAKALVEKENKQYSVEFDLSEKKMIGSTEIPSSSESNGNINRENTEAQDEQKAKEVALQQTHGTITNVEKVTTQKGNHYKVTIDNSNEVAHVYVQSDTGKVSSVSSIPKKQSDDMDDDQDDDQDDDNEQEDDQDD
jgi:uncharacterized membrane protein YkoI